MQSTCYFKTYQRKMCDVCRRLHFRLKPQKSNKKSYFRLDQDNKGNNTLIKPDDQRMSLRHNYSISNSYSWNNG